MLCSKIATVRFGPGPINTSIGLIAEPKRFPVFKFLPCTTSVRTIRARFGSRLQLACMRWILRLEGFRRFSHDPGDPASLESNDIKSTGEDKEGAFWVATSDGLDSIRPQHRQSQVAYSGS